MDIQQHMLMVQQLVAQAFVQNGLALHLLPAIQGPHTITITLRLYQPTKSNLDKALKLQRVVETAIGDGPVRITMQQGVLLIECPSPVPVIVHARTLHGQDLAVPLGVTGQQTVAGIDLARHPHLLLVGPTNVGKTTAARGIAYQLARQRQGNQVRYIVSTFKPKDWQAFRGLTNTWAVISDPVESGEMLHYLHDVMLRRTAASLDEPRIVIFLDDLLNLLGCVDVTRELSELASLGRGAGIHLIIGTQWLGKKGAGDATVTGNILTRLIFPTASAQDAASFSGRGKTGAEQIGRYPGDALLVKEGSTQRLAVAYVADEELRTLPRRQDEYRPWLGSTRRKSGQRLAHLPREATLISSTTRAASRVTRHATEGCVWRQDDETAPPLPSRVTRDAEKLPNCAPGPTERAQLRTLYAETQSKRATLKAAYGGVVNDDGNTPKTRRWLNEALTEVNP